ncbi:LacI family DNA-binding transcriptional regulator [Pelagovum pacificum]|uniref:LacI family DNA-binding transcriptional regulator n=1 Tax=Pelagovum pacificum TaxID=2588711 RepID=UPI0018CFEE62|nr:LacI family DNA-binding transcriptional regulator [Pelagovum pacificum]QQA43509.1 LacI family DNA-binding transcriptional regulator [Pelagovum pacificum]
MDGEETKRRPGPAGAGGPIRLSDIAARTGFSKNTVSLAMRGNPRIPEKTRDYIRGVAEDMDYVPNHVARALTSRRTRTIGVVLSDISNPVLTETSKVIESQLRAKGYSMLFASSSDSVAAEVEAIRMFRTRQLDGALVYPTRPQRNWPHAEEMRRAGFPIVLVTPGGEGGADLVAADEFAGARMAAIHLVEEGYRRIGVVDGDGQDGNADKLNGVRAGLRDAGLSFDEALRATPETHSPAGGFSAMERLMTGPERPDAVFLASDYLAIGAQHWCHLNGLRIPSDVALVGFDNIALSEFMPTPLTSVDFDIGHIAELAIGRLMTLIDAPGLKPPPTVTLVAPRLIVRDSSRRQRSMN